MGEESYDGGNSLNESNPDPSSSLGLQSTVWQCLTKQTNADKASKLFSAAQMSCNAWSDCLFEVNNQHYNHNDCHMQKGQLVIIAK